LRIKVKAKTGAPREAVNGFMEDGTLKLAVSARPVRGAANRAIVALLARRLGLSRGKIRIVSGESSRTKLVEIDGLEPGQLKEALG